MLSGKELKGGSWSAAAGSAQDMHWAGGGEAASYIALEQNTVCIGLLAKKKFSSTLLQRK